MVDVTMTLPSGRPESKSGIEKPPESPDDVGLGWVTSPVVIASLSPFAPESSFVIGVNPDPVLWLAEHARNGSVTPVKQSAQRRVARLMGKSSQRDLFQRR